MASSQLYLAMPDVGSLLLVSLLGAHGLLVPSIGATMQQQMTTTKVTTRTAGQCVLLARKKSTAAGKSRRGKGTATKKANSARPAMAWAEARSQPPKISKAQTAALWKLLMSGDAKPRQVAKMLQQGADVNKPDREGYTPLHIACRGGLTGVANTLLDGGAHLEAIGGGGAARPIHLASLGDHAEVVELLLKQGAAVDGTDGGDIGGTALHFAANAGAHRVIDVLLAAGASVDALSRDGRSLMHFASFCPDATVAEKLLLAGARPLPESKPWPRDRPPLQVLGEFATYTEVDPRIELCEQPESSLFAEHAVLHFNDFDGEVSPQERQAGFGGDGGALAIHRFLVRPDNERASVRSAGSLDDAIVRAAAQMRSEDPAGALRSNQGGYHSSATLRERPEYPGDECWAELHTVLDAAASAALEVEAEAGRAPQLEAERNGEPRVKVTDSWVNVNKGKGDFNKLHMHLPAVYSGVYYAQPPEENTDRLNGAFVLPLTTRDAADSATSSQDGSQQGTVTFSLMCPQRGMLMLFPASMLHAVLPTYSKTGSERISIGFNVSPFW